MSFHEITETAYGLQLEVEGSPVAMIRDHDGKLDLVWQVRGPQSLDTAKRTVAGILDLIVQYDARARKK